MQGFIAVVLVLGGLIFFHELGHFLVARLLGIGVRTFSLGFGPKIFSFVKGRTRYQVSIVPLGGYVHLAGENPEEGPSPDFPESADFSRRPAWHRMLVVSAGPLFNFVLAWLIYWGLLWGYGKMELLPGVGEVLENGPAAQAGIEPGDLVTAVDEKPVSYWREMAEAIQESQGQTLTFTVQRGSQTLALKITPETRVHKNLFGEEIKTPMIGVTSSGGYVILPLGGGSAMVDGVVQTWDVISLTFKGIVKIVQGAIPRTAVGGPIWIAQMVTEQAREGLANLLTLAAIISVNLGLINLLPIPVLDGGHILFFGLETIFRRPVPNR
ncbi:MAG: M50 family metallopeptidase, partial [Thermodesulfobacteriota bacterium]|nr:M50 family metallopeptidase [Thermodesulfobacteriota bacterium]